MAFKLPSLSYAYDALEPYIDKATMEIHHTKHHQAYIDKLNEVVSENPSLEGKTVEDILGNLDSFDAQVKQKLENFAGGHYNHSLFWEWMKPAPIVKPVGLLSDAINSTFGSFDAFKEQFTTKAMSIFGSGWAFLIKDKDGKMSLKRHSFQNSPIMRGNLAIVGIDVWEHAYYLKYQNRRKDYIDAWWNVVNWERISASFESK